MERTLLNRAFTLCLAIIFAFICLCVPINVHAADKNESKAKYTLTISNLDSNTVITKGKKLKVKARAVDGNGKKLKLRYKTSNKKIASVTRTGIIKGIKNGKVRITVLGQYRGKTKVKKAYTINVGKQVSSVSLTGCAYLRVGKTYNYTANVKSEKATNKKVVYSSSDSSIVKVTNAGKVVGLKNGSAVITVKAVDGSGKQATKKVYSHKYTKTDTKWVAHRGLSTEALENTAEAFRLAGQNGFWGCECDIWETMHVVAEETGGAPENVHNLDDVQNSQDTNLLSADQLETGVEPNEESEIRDLRSDEPAPADDENSEFVDESNSNEISNDVETDIQSTNNQSVNHENELMEPDESKDDSIEQFAASNEENEINSESFDLVISHDDSFERLFGVNKKIKSMTTAEIKSNQKLSQVCFFEEYLDICKAYKMVPIIELKDRDMSDAAIEKTVDIVYEKGMLDSAHFISFYYSPLSKAKEYSIQTYHVTPYSEYLIGTNANIMSSIAFAKTKEFTGVNIWKSLLDDEVYDTCQKYGLRLGTWTYKGTDYDDKYLYQHVVEKKYRVDSLSIDGKLFQ